MSNACRDCYSSVVSFYCRLDYILQLHALTGPVSWSAIWPGCTSYQQFNPVYRQTECTERTHKCSFRLFAAVDSNDNDLRSFFGRIGLTGAWFFLPEFHHLCRATTLGCRVPSVHNNNSRCYYWLTQKFAPDNSKHSCRFQTNKTVRT